MLKKITITLMLIIPMGVFAQKFGHTYSQEILVLLPEYTKMQTDLQAMEKQYEEEMKRTNEEIQKKYTEFQQALQEGNLPQNIQERRQKDLQDLMERSEQFQQEAYKNMQTSYQQMLAPVVQKVDNAIKEVGQAESMVYIFDLSRTVIPFVNENLSSDVTAKVKSKLGL